MYDHTFYKQVQISRSDIRPHIKWAVSLVILHMITSIFLRALCGIMLANNLKDELDLKRHENSLYRRGNAFFPTLKIAPQRSNIIYSRRCAKKKAHILFHAAYPYLKKSPDPSYCSEGQIRRLRG